MWCTTSWLTSGSRLDEQTTAKNSSRRRQLTTLAPPGESLLTGPAVRSEEESALLLDGPEVWGEEGTAPALTGPVVLGIEVVAPAMVGLAAWTRGEITGYSSTAAQSQPPLWLWVGWAAPEKHGHIDQLTTCEISRNLHPKRDSNIS
jgi:hypothetical protein